MILSIAEQIKKLRIENNFTQSELAKRLNVSRSAVNAWEQGTNNPTLNYAVELAETFNVSLDYLIGRGDEDSLDISELSKTEKKAIRQLISCFKTNKAEKE